MLSFLFCSFRGGRHDHNLDRCDRHCWIVGARSDGCTRSVLWLRCNEFAFAFFRALLPPLLGSCSVNHVAFQRVPCGVCGCAPCCVVAYLLWRLCIFVLRVAWLCFTLRLHIILSVASLCCT